MEENNKVNVEINKIGKRKKQQYQKFVIQKNQQKLITFNQTI